jgi:hypothetical protein
MTLINHAHGFVFVHVPKNAGTSVAQYLSALSTYRDLEIGATALGEAAAPHIRQRFGLHKHSTLAEIRDVLGADTLSDFHTMAIVRDPEDRVRSVFEFLRAWPAWANLDPDYADHAGDFALEPHRIAASGRTVGILGSLARRPRRPGSTVPPSEPTDGAFAGVDDFIESDLFTQPGPDRLFEPQSTWLTLDAETVAIDHVIRFGHLQRDLSRIIRELGLPTDQLGAGMPRSNSSYRRREAPLRPTSIARLRERYATDYELLGPWL